MDHGADRGAIPGWFGQVILAFAVVTVLALPGNSAQADDEPASKKARKLPNILFFHVDDTSVGDWGCYGGAYPLGAKTPNVDRLASESLMLTNYNVEAQCTPSRAALMTGRYSVRTGCTTAIPGA